MAIMAKEKMDEYEEKLNKAKQVSVSEHLEQDKPSKLQEILNSSDIPSDLLDD